MSQHTEEKCFTMPRIPELTREYSDMSSADEEEEGQIHELSEWIKGLPDCGEEVCYKVMQFQDLGFVYIVAPANVLKMNGVEPNPDCPAARHTVRQMDTDEQMCC